MQLNHARSIILCACLFSIFFLGSCDSTRHIQSGHYLLRRNNIDLHSDLTITRRGELKDQLASLVIQKPNLYFAGLFPYKVWLYNLRYKRYLKDTSAASFQVKSKTVEPPVIYDSILRKRSVVNLQAYLFNEGYFYARIRDSVILHGKKADAVYRIETGFKYLIHQRTLDCDDSTITDILSRSMSESVLKTGVAFSNILLQAEQARLVEILRNEGYYKFTRENIHFVLDTADTAGLMRIVQPENPIERTINFLALQKNKDSVHTLGVRIVIRAGEDNSSYRQYRIGNVTVYPDYNDRGDLNDPGMRTTTYGAVSFRYHKYYLRERVLLSHIFLEPGDYYRQNNYDLTINKLNELGLFQYVRVVLNEDSTADNLLRCTILLNPTKKYEFNPDFEVSNGSTYFLGSALSFNFYNRNMLKGADQLTISLSGGIEGGYNENEGENFFDHFYLLSRNAGLNFSISFPKFISPLNTKHISKRAIPRTIVGLGFNLLDRVDYFTLTNITANFSYNWKETATKTWDVSPAFINILKLPRIADTFQHRLDSNQFLRNSYRENFIEGESITFTFNNQNAQLGNRSYSFITAGIEEAGGLLSGVNAIGGNKFSFNYSKYLRIDLDARHYFRWLHSLAAFRFFSGWGIPYGGNTTLPYIKQYFSGGAYSLRGWRIRTLGPGSYFDTTNANSSNTFIDRTGDIKLEMNAEYRFDIVQLFGGAMRLNGAVFADAGNVWLAHEDPSYPGGEFSLKKIGQDIAMSTGAGARLDIGGLFVLRLDAGFPIKKPYIPDNSGWVIKDIRFGDKTWRANNVILNIAIGYPF